MLVTTGQIERADAPMIENINEKKIYMNTSIRIFDCLYDSDRM